MLVEPERLLDDFVRAGADHVLVQSEPSSTIHLHRVLSRIRELGKKAGVVLNPASPIVFIEQVVHLCNIVLVRNKRGWLPVGGGGSPPSGVTVRSQISSDPVAVPTFDARLSRLVTAGASLRNA